MYGRGGKERGEKEVGGDNSIFRYHLLIPSPKHIPSGRSPISAAAAAAVAAAVAAALLDVGNDLELHFSEVILVSRVVSGGQCSFPPSSSCPPHPIPSLSRPRRRGEKEGGIEDGKEEAQNVVFFLTARYFMDELPSY